MCATHFKEFYSWVLMMSAQNKSIDCMVVSGCGSSQVWVKYCRRSLKYYSYYTPHLIHGVILGATVIIELYLI